MDLNKKNIIKTLEKITFSGETDNIVSSGVLQNVQVFGDQVDIGLLVSNPALQARKRLEVDIMKIIHSDIYEKAKIKITCEVQKKVKNPDSDNSDNSESSDVNITSEAKKILGVDSIIAISSAKGGVGKSTLTVNLAASLAKKGCKVGILDADIYGPSVPTMMDVEGYVPKAVKINDVSKIEPAESYGVKIMSIGFFTKLDQAVVWRGPMASKALNQLIWDAHWGELDYLLVDLPPGTGDIHLSLVQSIPITGAVVVTTPQNISLEDAKKGISMFKMDSINVPVLGLVENMSYFTPAELSQNKYYIFGKNGGKELAENMNIELLAQIPLVQSVREAADAGRPALLQGSTPIAIEFLSMTKEIVSAINKRNVKLAPTKAVELTNKKGCSK